MDLVSLKQDVLTTESFDFYQQYLLGNEVWYYKNYLAVPDYSSTYDAMKRYIAQRLDIHFNDIAIFGSAKIGFSLNPGKGFRDFCEKSDIDIVLVSDPLFKKFWDAYLEMYSGLRYITNYSLVTSSLFRQFICLDGFDIHSQAFLEWSKKTDGFKKDLQLLFHFGNHKINYRIFSSWEAVKRYYIRNLDDLKRTKKDNGGPENDQNN